MENSYSEVFMNKSIKFKVLEFLATWLYSGKAPKAPGTCGSLATLPFVFALAYFGGMYAVIAFALAVALLGIPVAGEYAKILNRKDPGQIVIDEVAGQSLALVFAGTNLWLFGLGFLLFRLFDISKPWLVGWADTKLSGGLGIMLDDVFAGIFAGIFVWLVQFYFF